VKRLPKVLYDVYEVLRGDLRVRKFERLDKSTIYVNIDGEMFDNLRQEDGLKSASIAFDFIAHILSLAGTSEKTLPLMHSWTGIVSGRET